MNVPQTPRGYSKLRCFDSRNKSPMPTYCSGPPSIILIPPSSAPASPSSCRHHRRSAVDVMVSPSSSSSVVSKGTDDEQRWLPCKSEKRPSLLPSVLPRRQASYHTESSCCSSSLCSNDGASYSILSECEKLSQELTEMLKNLENGKRDRGDSSPSKLSFSHRNKRLNRFRQLGEDQDSTKSASLPRQPCRQMSFARREKRWSACTADGSYTSLPDAENGKDQRRASLKPQKPRRQKSDVES